MVGIIIMAAAFGLQVFAMRPPAPKPGTAPENEFSAARAMVLLKDLMGDGAPHPTGSKANAAVRDRIINNLTALGYPVETQAVFACSKIWSACGDVENILTILPGRTLGPAVLLTAYYDSVGASQAPQTTWRA